MKTVYNIIEKVKNTSSTNGKLEILKQNSDNDSLKKTLEYTYNPSKVYGIAKKSLKQKNPRIHTDSNIFDTLDWLLSVNRNNENVQIINDFLNSQNEELRDLYTRIILKDLRCGISEKTVLKVFPKLFYLHEVQQAYPLKDSNKPKQGEWFALQQKWNGIRSDFIPNTEELLSRQGIAFKGLNHIIEEVKQLEPLYKYVFDGELIHCNDDNVTDEDNFTRTCSIVNSDEGDKSKIQFRVYDIIPYDEFMNGQSNLKFKDRYDWIMEFEELAKSRGLNHIVFSHNLYEGTDQSKIEEWLNYADSHNWEGCMLYKNDYYKCKRHNGLLKVKSFLSCDVRCIDVFEGQGKYENMLGGVTVDYKGHKVDVGSGFTDEQRKYYWNNKNEILDKIVQVKYKTESKNKNGGISLQFPIFQTVRIDKEVVSYN